MEDMCSTGDDWSLLGYCHGYVIIICFVVALLYIIVPIKKDFSRFLPTISDVQFPMTKAKDLNAMREEHDQVGELLGGGNSNILIFTLVPRENDPI